MKKAFKLFAFVFFTFLLFLVGIGTAFYHLVRVGEFRRFLVSEIEQSTELKVALGDGDLEIGRILGIAFRDVAISEPNAPQPSITAERITARVALLPLLRRKLIFYEIRLEKPAARMERDKEGKLPLLDRLLNLPFLKTEDAQFGLDLRAVRITDGEVDFRDDYQEGLPSTTYLRGVDLRLQRFRGQALREFFQKLVRKKSKQPQGTALEFDLKTWVEKDHQVARVSAEGMMAFPEDKLEFQKAWWDAKTQVTALPTPMVQSFTGRRLALRSMSGSMDASLQLEGNPYERLHVQGHLVFKGLAVDAPEIFSAPLHPGEGRVDLDVNWAPQQWDFSRFELRSKELNFAMRGALRAAPNHEDRVQLSLTTPSLPITTVKKYLPTKWLAWPELDSLAAAVQEGELRFTKAGVNATLSELKRLLKTGFDERVGFEAELHNIAANFNGGYLPL